MNPGAGWNRQVKTTKGITMIRKFKALGLAVVAVLAMSAFAASAAQAVPVATTSAGPSVSVHGTGENIGEKFTVDGVTTECKTSHYTGTATNGSDTFELTPTYTNCTLAGTELVVHVTHEGCKFHFTLTERVTTIYRAHVKIVCNPGPIRIHATGVSCEATVGAAENENLTTVDITNDATDITIKPTVTGITATVTKDGFLCPFSSVGHKTGGTYTTTGYITGTASSGTLQVSGE